MGNDKQPIEKTWEREIMPSRRGCMGEKKTYLCTRCYRTFRLRGSEDTFFCKRCGGSLICIDLFSR